MAEQIRVTTEELRKSQEEWRQSLKQIEKALCDMKDLQDKLDLCFQGQPVVEWSGKMEKMYEEGMLLFEGFEMHIEKLGEIASIYEKPEGRNAGVTTDH